MHPSSVARPASNSRQNAPTRLLPFAVIAVVASLTACGTSFTEPCTGVDELLATPEIVLSHDGETPVLTFDGGHKGYQMGVYNHAKRQDMWSVYASSGEAIGDEDFHVIGSPIRYGDADFGEDVEVEANEAFPLEEGETYTLWLGRGCTVGYGNSQNSIAADFVYTRPAVE
jgi:hypothetical protein